MIRLWFVTGVVLLMGSPLSAQSTATDQSPADPVITEEALPSEVGEWELRLTADFTDDRIVVPKLQTFFGIIDRVGGELASAFSDEDGSYGASAFGGSVKWLAVSERGSVPAIIVGLEIETMTLAGRNPFEIVPFVSVLKVFGRTAVQGRVGPILRVRDGEETEGDEPSVAVDVALLVPVGPRLHLIGEAGRGEGAAYVAPGLRYQVTERISLATAVPFHVDERQARFVIQLQATFGAP